MTDTQAPTAAPPIEAWIILEQYGHIRLAGRVTEEQHFGVTLGRLEIPNRGGGFTTRWFGGSSVYAITPVSEEIARQVALHNEPGVVHRWELPAPQDHRTTDAPEPYETQYGESGRDIDDEDDDDPERF